MTHRIQLSRAAGWRLPPGAVSVAAPTKWANPYRPAVRTPAANAEAVGAYRQHLREHPDLAAAARTELAGKDLACWCAPDLPCHADVLLEVAREPSPELPVACTLGPIDGRERWARWRALTREAPPVITRRDNILEASFPSDVDDELAALVAAEERCCSFVSWWSGTVNGRPTVRVTAKTDGSDGIAAVLGLFEV